MLSPRGSFACQAAIPLPKVTGDFPRQSRSREPGILHLISRTPLTGSCRHDCISACSEDNPRNMLGEKGVPARLLGQLIFLLPLSSRKGPLKKANQAASKPLPPPGALPGRLPPLGSWPSVVRAEPASSVSFEQPGVISLQGPGTCLFFWKHPPSLHSRLRSNESDFPTFPLP